MTNSTLSNLVKLEICGIDFEVWGIKIPMSASSHADKYLNIQFESCERKMITDFYLDDSEMLERLCGCLYDNRFLP